MSELQSRLRQRMVALAPVASITNSIYRRLCKRLGADYVVTELVSSEGLTRDSLRSYELARFTPEERPVGVQIFGGDPARLVLFYNGWFDHMEHVLGVESEALKLVADEFGSAKLETTVGRSVVHALVADHFLQQCDGLAGQRVDVSHHVATVCERRVPQGTLSDRAERHARCTCAPRPAMLGACLASERSVEATTTHRS